nr:RING finger protein DG17-like [Hydra vulgaris]
MAKYVFLFKNHLETCEYQEVKCLNEQCSTSLLRKELRDHMETKCIYRLVTCQYCNQKIRFCEKQTHLETCESLPLYCVNQCGMKILRKEMSTHITDSCANTVIPCQYFYIGCNFKEMRNQNHVLTTKKMEELENKTLLIEKEMKTKMAIPKDEKLCPFEPV